MNNRISVALLCVLVFTVCVTAAIAPATARSLNSDLWTGKVGPAERLPSVEIGDDLLKAGGHTIILNQRSESFTIPITIKANEAVSGTLSASVPSSTWFTVLPLSTPVTLSKGQSQTVEFTITMIHEASGSRGPDSKLSFDVFWAAGATRLSGTFEMYDEESRHFDFLETNGLLTGVFSDPPGWYSVKHPLFLSLDEAARLKFGRTGDGELHGFPAGTAYSFEGEEYLLYDGGTIDLESGGKLLIDFSKTDVHGTIRISTDSATHEFSEADAIGGVVLDTPLISSSGGKSVNLSYYLGDVAPTFTAKRLTAGSNGTFSWTATDKITCRRQSDGNVYLDTSAALAGTYLVNFSWIYQGNTLYSTEMELFVRYASGGQGGNVR